MHPVLRIPYAAAGAAANLAASASAAIAPNAGAKWLASLRARHGIRARYSGWGKDGRDPSRPLLWVHAPSVGEGLQARAMIALLRERRPDLQVAYTYFSPSAARFAERIGADFTDYLPFDTRRDAETALEALRPAAIVFSKLDVWPMLVERAAHRGTALGLISGTLARASARRSRMAELLLRDAYAALDAVGAISADDGERLHALGVRGDRITVTGDARYDEAWGRASATQGALIVSLRSDRATLVAGSTWPADEAPLFEAWRALRDRVSDARLIVAPHEPTQESLARIARWADTSGFRRALTGDSSAADADVIVVDRVGVLVDLYAVATVAYVGGGFHAAGLHSVIEPAAFGVPVLFGPHFTASRDAELLIERGGGFAVDSSAELSRQLVTLMGDRGERDIARSRARALVESGLGAAERSAALVNALL
jgi:3-deoxy-D-manno-octulosonic-acid transferase